MSKNLVKTVKEELDKQFSEEMALEEKTGHATLEVLFNKDWAIVGKKGDKVH